MATSAIAQGARQMRCLRQPSKPATAPTRSARVAARSVRAIDRRPLTVAAASTPFAPPPVAETKRKFLDLYKKPIPGLYNTVVQELLVQQHFVRYSVNYQYDQITALGFVSVFEQILDSYDAAERSAIFSAYIRALGEDPEKFKNDAAKVEATASAAGSPDALVPSASGNDVQKTLASIAERTAANKFAYNKFFAIGLFRLLELTGAKDPDALKRLVSALGVKLESVNKDLLMYKGILSKLSAAKEMLRDFLEREKKKQAEREAEKAAKAVAEKEGATASA